MQAIRTVRVAGIALILVLASMPVTAADSRVENIKERPSGGAGGKVGSFPDEQIDVKGKMRLYRLIVPKSVDPKKATPLVFAFHGLLDSKDLMPMYTQLDKLAEEKGFILIYPNGLNRHWPLIPQLAVDDVAFFDTLYAHASAKYNIDLNRIYLTGMSNGAYFSNLLASQRADKIAAIAPHSGGLGALATKDLDLKPKYAVLVIHGANDSIVPVSEGQKQRDTYKKWGHPVEYIEVPNHNHFWAHSIDVNTKIWAFFMSHPLSS